MIAGRIRRIFISSAFGISRDFWTAGQFSTRAFFRQVARPEKRMLRASARQLTKIVVCARERDCGIGLWRQALGRQSMVRGYRVSEHESLKLSIVGNHTPAVPLEERRRQRDALGLRLLPVTRRSMPAPAAILRLLLSEARTMTPVGSVRPTCTMLRCCRP